MLSGLGNFVVDCHIQSTSSSTVFAKKKVIKIFIDKPVRPSPVIVDMSGGNATE